VWARAGEVRTVRSCGTRRASTAVAGFCRRSLRSHASWNSLTWGGKSMMEGREEGEGTEGQEGNKQKSKQTIR